MRPREHHGRRCPVSNPIIVYHDKCPDGIAAAWAAWCVFGDAATYVPASYGDDPPTVTDATTGEARDVIVADFSYPREKIMRLHGEARSLLVLDHHASAEDVLRGLDFCVFDQTRSGAGLAWDVIAAPTRGPRPWIINYTEDRDLWRHALPNSREVNAWLRAQHRTLHGYAVAAATPLEYAIAQGREILATQRVYIEQTKARASLAVLAGFVVPVVNCGRHCASEIVGELAEGYPFAASWEARDGMIHYELRSRAPTAIPVNDIAREFGGGGHKMAAGFSVPRIVHAIAEGAAEVTP